ncbi:MAG TPA: phosphatase PAP2 family protein [Candidatus Acidoferrum sp.]|nr:phosphatase PAP2 family protein [Candidatus Angelobacter sp.]HXD82654.1 phosphatase PAP2 family protein [Candidatus Acidoferrum sp.]
MPALERLYPRLFAIVVLAVAFVALTIAITAGVFASLDHQVAEAMHSIWQESLQGLFQLIAELGGLELTTALMVGLFFYLWRGGFGADALVVIAFAGAVVLELVYKELFFHPGPPPSLSHQDGPSVTDLFLGNGLGNSFPSGHMVRAVVAYGLLAFVVRRLAPSRVARLLALPAATLIVVALAFDRLYLDVHWESDVIGGLLLGGIALVAATVWLDRPVKPDN